MPPTEEQPVALVTGAARRIGAALARGLHGAGYRVLVHYRHSRADAEQLAAALNHSRPESAALLQGELASPALVQRLAEEALGRWGRLDVLINNASDFFPGRLGKVREEDWERLQASNLKGPFFLSQALAPELRQRRGSILNMLDAHALQPLAGYPVYCAAKAGLLMLTRSLARELAPSVRVNGVAPGVILPPASPPPTSPPQKPGSPPPPTAKLHALIQRVPLRRPGSPEDLLQAALFLLHQASYTTGQVLQVDGGCLL